MPFPCSLNTSSSSSTSVDSSSLAEAASPTQYTAEDGVTRCICDYQHDDGYMICCDQCWYVQCTHVTHVAHYNTLRLYTRDTLQYATLHIECFTLRPHKSHFVECSGETKN